MPEVKYLKVLEYVCVTYQTRYARATGAQKTFSARLTHAWSTLLTEQYLIKNGTCACSVHWRASNVRRMHSKRIQRDCNARGAYSKRIRHTPGTRRASRKNLSMFEKFLSPNQGGAATFSDVYQRAPSLYRASNVSPTCFWRMLNFTFCQHARRAFDLYANV